MGTDLTTTPFFEAVNACHATLAEETIKLFGQWWNDLRFNTFICSVSEHEDSEDAHGRLSMWRAFGQTATARAAMVMRMPDDGAASGLHVMMSPVAYFGYAEVEAQLHNVIGNINTNRNYLAGLDRDLLKSRLFFMLAAAAIRIKHIGFDEEKEWRAIYLPRANPSKVITPSTEIVSGIPQIVHKIPLEGNPAEDVIQMAMPTLVDRVIIGPTMYGAPMYQAFVQALTDAGITDAASRVVISGIPIRS